LRQIIVNDSAMNYGIYPLPYRMENAGAAHLSRDLPSVVADEGFRRALTKIQSTVALSTVPGGVFLVGCPNETSPLHVAHVPLEHAWGLAADSQRLAVATHREIIVFANSPLLSSAHPDRPEYFDAFFTPRVTFFTGECLIHDMAIVRTGLLASNTRFSNVSLIDGKSNFDPVWHPYFISALTPDDRCHLNGMAVENGRLRYVTTFGAFDEPRGWRSHGLDFGVILDVERNAILTEGLCLPHSPRLIDGQLFVLEGGTGTVLRVDRDSGQAVRVAGLPGFVRGMAAAEGIMFVGLSVIRSTDQGTALPVARSGIDLVAGVAAVDIASGTILGMLRFNEGREIFDVVLIPSVTRAGISNSAEAGSLYAVDSRAGSYWMRFDGTNGEAGG
jgi:uncharacterized protein (TIGR03032 family)